MNKAGSRKTTSRSPIRKNKSGHPGKVRYIVPQLDGELVSYRQFMERQNEAWFQEKYDPIQQARFTKEKREEALFNSEDFFNNLKEHKFDDIKLDLLESELKDLKDEDQEELQTFQEMDQQSYHQEVYFKSNIDVTKSPYYGFDADRNTLFIRNISNTLSRFEFKEKLKNLPGFLSLSISDPTKISDNSRFGWVQFKDPESTEQAIGKIQSLMIDDHQFLVQKSQKSGKKLIKIAGKIDSKKALEVTTELIKALDKEKNIKENPLMQELDENLEKKRLDLQILYLRRVHSYCYFCGVQYHDERMLSSKCSVQHLRLCPGEGEQEEEISFDFPTWQTKSVQIAEKKIKEINNKYAGSGEMEEEKNMIDEEKEAEELIRNQFIEKIEKEYNSAQKYPCNLCSKKFIGITYLIKHQETKHPQEFQEKLKESRQEIALQNYCNDPMKLTTIPKKGGGIQNQKSNKKFQQKHKKYRDWDEPTEAPQEIINTANLINYNDI
ncbi:hypothetical protein PPERSA_12641 [Pseudocohnilembus persalinus]|uniref:C2H2-type domain-containing protein n=1 Tax=Pseudocohnilembus persalinus TaxID=266149 RepID=A0A0V0QCL7_PSEPJ|nr:hypothetical protein PPERSA_12641 [Pseudocohnilembus persalinus]|eukprot:KRW99965.1 hypothetical protein PPERSA_12641 [Pseudocohnilembus persalinus]